MCSSKYLVTCSWKVQRPCFDVPADKQDYYSHLLFNRKFVCQNVLYHRGKLLCYCYQFFRIYDPNFAKFLQVVSVICDSTIDLFQYLHEGNCGSQSCDQYVIGVTVWHLSIPNYILVSFPSDTFLFSSALLPYICLTFQWCAFFLFVFISVFLAHLCITLNL